MAIPLDRITVDPQVMEGRPCIRDLRLTVNLIINLLARGMTCEEILQINPCLEKEDVMQCLTYAARRTDDGGEGSGSPVLAP
jgi:uncharacterized protein (DUF433 family)